MVPPWDFHGASVGFDGTNMEAQCFRTDFRWDIHGDLHRDFHGGFPWGNHEITRIPWGRPWCFSAAS